ncbi:MAG: hypothetical protein JRC58_08350 [Deltaproteobacteria bacterium]|nr:hypothetical protein [Deltaproteobacteria bacterium]
MAESYVDNLARFRYEERVAGMKQPMNIRIRHRRRVGGGFSYGFIAGVLNALRSTLEHYRTGSTVHGIIQTCRKHSFLL